MLQDETTVLDAIRPPEGRTCVVTVPDSLRVVAFAYTGNRFIDYNVTPGGRVYVRWKLIGRRSRICEGESPTMSF